MNVSLCKYWGFKLNFKSLTRVMLTLGWVMLVAVRGASALDERPKDEAAKRAKLFEVRSAMIPQLEGFIARHPGDARINEFRIRLAESHFEIAKYYEFTNQKDLSKKSMGKAMELLESVKSAASHSPDYDHILYILGSAYDETQQHEKAGDVYSELASKFPNSPYIKDSALRLGDFYFDKNQNAKADTFYQIALGDPKMQSYIYYKMAWTSMNQGLFTRALQNFEKVIHMKGTDAAQTNDYSKEASRELVWPAIQVYKAKGVLPYMEKVLGDTEMVQSNVTDLAKGLLGKSEFAVASALYDELALRYPQSPRMREWVSNQIKAEEKLGRPQRITELLARLKGIPAAPGAEGQAVAQVDSEVLNTAKKFHALAQKATSDNEKKSNFKMAATYYSAYLNSQPGDTAPATEARFYLAEVKYGAGDFYAAAPLYEEVTKAATATPNIRAQAGWAWFLSLEKLADGFHYAGKTFKQASGEDEKYLEAARQLQTIPGISAEQKRKASYQSARLLYQLNDYDRALPVFQALADTYGPTNEGKLSAQLVLDIYNIKKDFKSVAQYAKAYQGNADAGTRSEFQDLAAKASLKGLQQEEVDAKALSGEARFAALETISKKYLDFAHANSHSDLAEKLLYAAFENFTEVAIERKDPVYEDVRSSFKFLESRYGSSAEGKKAIPLMFKFLAYRGGTTAAQIKEFAEYRGQWKKVMEDEPADKRGIMAMLIFDSASSESEKKSMRREFASLPKSDANRVPLAYAQLSKVEELNEKIERIHLDNMKSLGRNTGQRANLLDQLQSEVTKLAKMKVAEPVIAGLKILAEANRDMASALREAPVPKQLQGADLQKYMGIVREKAGEFESKANEADRLSSEKAKEFNLSAS